MLQFGVKLRETACDNVKHKPVNSIVTPATRCRHAPQPCRSGCTEGSLPVLTISLIAVPAVAAGLLVRRLATNPFLQLLGASFDSWADAARQGPELV